MIRKKTNQIPFVIDGGTYGLSGIDVQGHPPSPAVLASFIELAGGEAAKLVLIPTGWRDETLEGNIAAYRKVFPPGRLTILHTRDRKAAASPEFAPPLRNATGGGPQCARVADTRELWVVQEEQVPFEGQNAVRNDHRRIANEWLITNALPSTIQAGHGDGLEPFRHEELAARTALSRSALVPQIRSQEERLHLAVRLR